MGKQVIMAGRTRNRLELRKQAEQAEAVAAETPNPEAPVKKPKKTTTTRKPRAPKTPPRMQARWGVFDSGLRQVAVFDFNQRDAAEAKVADLVARNKGLHFLQIVKEPIPEKPESETDASS
jgi:hypothetical protein